MAPSEDCYSYLCEWHDPQSDIVKSFKLLYFTINGTIELFDIKNRRTFLRRCAVPSVGLDDLFLGNTVTIYSRPMKLIDYADSFTRHARGSTRETVFLLVKPGAFHKIGVVMTGLARLKVALVNIKSTILPPGAAKEFLDITQDQSDTGELTSGPVVGIEVNGEDAVCAVNAVAGPVNSAVAPRDTLRHSIGSLTSNGLYVSQTAAAGTRDAQWFFPGGKCPFVTTAYIRDCSLCVVKPHAVLKGHTGDIISAVTKDGLQITAVQSFQLTSEIASEFLEVYKGVIPEFATMVDALCDGLCVAMEVTGGSVVPRLRSMAGPMDPEMARSAHPGTLRAVFGDSRSHNAIHCTDLEDDGVLECEYFFKILQ